MRTLLRKADCQGCHRRVLARIGLDPRGNEVSLTCQECGSGIEDVRFSPTVT